MAIDEGDKVPDATLMWMGEGRPEEVPLADKMSGRKVVIFGLPGAYTGTCSSAHIPSFIRVMDDLVAKGVDEVICIAVNDPFVLKAWGEQTGASAAGITLLGDPECTFTKAIGMEFSAPPVGLISRSSRYAMVVEDGVIKTLHREQGPGMCDVSGGEAILATL